MGSSLHILVTRKQIEKKVRKTKKIGNKKNGIAFNIDASSDTNKFTPHNLVNKEI